MIDLISAFLTSKNLSDNSQKSYTYDLKQFLTLVNHQITETKLRIYESSLVELKPTAQKRKISAVNQFLYFLYQEGHLDTYYRLKAPKALSQPIENRKEDLDLSSLKELSAFGEGYLIALLMSHLGLTPSEISQLKWEHIDLTFDIVTIENNGNRRILPLDECLKAYLGTRSRGRFLFDHHGKSYSRQWHFQQLKAYLEALGLGEWTAQSLRQQFIKNQVARGKSSHEIAKHLGLKSTVTLEKYFS